MSDSQQGPGWWLASDGKWYAPEQRPGSAALPPPDVRPQPTAPPPITPTPTTPFGSPDGVGKKPWWRRWWAIAIAAVVALAVVAGIAGNTSDDESGDQDEQAVGTVQPDQADDVDEQTDGDDGSESDDADAAPGDEPADTDEATAGDEPPNTDETTSSEDDQQVTDDSPPPEDAAPVVGTREVPYPIGQPVTIELDSFGDGDGSVWTLTVVGPGTDMTKAVARENSFNEPPAEGSIFYGVPVTLTLESADKEPLSTLFNIELELFGPITLSIIDDGLEDGCGVVPDGIDPFREVFVGGTVAGTVCLAVPTEDVAADVLLTTDSLDGDRIFFATTGEVVEATPADEGGGEPPQSVPVDETTDLGGRSNPYPIGESAVITVDTLGEGDGSVWALTVDGPGTDLTRAVLDENPFNQAPPDGSVYYGVPVSVTLVAAVKEPLALFFNVELEYYGPSTLSIIDLGIDEGCGVTPNEIDRAEEVFIDGTVSGTLCLTVAEADVAAGVLLTTDSIEGERIYFVTS